VFVSKEELKYLPFTTQQPSETPVRGIAAKTAGTWGIIPIISSGVWEQPAVKTMGGLKMMGAEEIIPRAKEFQISPQKEHWELLPSVRNFEVPAEKERRDILPLLGTLPALQPAFSQIQITSQIPGQPDKIREPTRTPPEEPPPEFPRFGGRAIDIFNVPKSKVWRTGKERRGRGSELPWASIYSTQRTQARTGGISHQPAINLKTLTAWKGAVVSGRGLRTPEESRGFGRIRISAFAKRKKRRKGLI
jgi:hypothetical protein